MEDFKELFNKYIQELESYCHDRVVSRQYSLKAIRDFYSSVCEFVHSNTDGFVGSYSYLDEEYEMIYLGPQMKLGHSVYGAFPTTLLVALDINLVAMHSIYDNLEEFTRVCEEAIKDKNT